MNPFSHPKFSEANRAATLLAATLGHVIRNPEAVPRAIMETGAWVVRGAPLADAATLAERQAICGGDEKREKCQHWLPTEPGGAVMHCAVCKCLKAKLAMATTHCPLGKWGPVAGRRTTATSMPQDLKM
jgi:hypothetical protein